MAMGIRDLFLVLCFAYLTFDLVRLLGFVKTWSSGLLGFHNETEWINHQEWIERNAEKICEEAGKNREEIFGFYMMTHLKQCVFVWLVGWRFRWEDMCLLGDALFGKRNGSLLNIYFSVLGSIVIFLISSALGSGLRLLVPRQLHRFNFSLMRMGLPDNVRKLVECLLIFVVCSLGYLTSWRVHWVVIAVLTTLGVPSERLFTFSFNSIIVMNIFHQSEMDNIAEIGHAAYISGQLFPTSGQWFSILSNLLCEIIYIVEYSKEN